MQKCVWMSMKGQGLSSLKAEDTYFVVFKSHYTQKILKNKTCHRTEKPCAVKAVQLQKY